MSELVILGWLVGSALDEGTPDKTMYTGLLLRMVSHGQAAGFRCKCGVFVNVSGIGGIYRKGDGRFCAFLFVLSLHFVFMFQVVR